MIIPGIYKLMKFRYFFWLYWKIRHAARYKSLNSHWKTGRGTEITLSETSSPPAFFFPSLPNLISEFVTCSLSPYPQWSRMHFHGNLGWAVFSGLLSQAEWSLGADGAAWTLNMPSSSNQGDGCPSRGFITNVHYKYMNHRYFWCAFKKNKKKKLHRLVPSSEKQSIKKTHTCA